MPCGFALSYPKSARLKLLRTAKREIFDRFWQRRAQSYAHTTSADLLKDAERACFAAGLYYFCLAKRIADEYVIFSSFVGLHRTVLLSIFERQGDTHGFDESVCRLYFLRFIFLGDMPVEADGELYARTLDYFLLFLVFEKLGYVIVRLKGVQTVVVDVDFPKDARFRHFAEIAVRLFADGTDKRKHIRMRNPRRATATLSKGKNIPVRNRGGIVEIFHQRKIEKGHVRGMGQGIAVLALQGANFDTAKELYPARVFFLQRLDMVVIPNERFAVVGVKASAFIPTKIRPRATDSVVVVANPKLLDTACDSGFNHRFGAVVRAEGIVGMCV